MPSRRRVLFVCSHNSARSQMAEGWLRELGGDAFDAHSAGLESRGLHPMAVQAMAEAGVDISLQRGKTLDAYEGAAFDIGITVCDEANEACPVIPGARERRHWSFPDPSKVTGTEDERYAFFTQVRDAIRSAIEALVAESRNRTA